MIETLLTLAIIVCLMWAINGSLNAPFEWEDDFWKALIEDDLYEPQ